MKLLQNDVYDIKFTIQLHDKDKTQVFYPQTIKILLMDEGIIKDKKNKRPPTQQRLTSRHKNPDSHEVPTQSQDGTVCIEPPRPILEIIQ